MTKGIVDVVLPLYLKDLGIAIVGIGFIFSLAPVIGIIAQSIIAVHSDVVGRKGYFSLTFLLKSAAHGFYSICTIPTGFAALNTLDSLSENLRSTVEMPLIVEITPKEKLGRIVSAYWGILSVAIAVGMGISGIITTLIGYFWLFLLCSFISLVGLILIQTARIPPFKRKNVSFNFRKMFDFRQLGWNLKVLFLIGFVMSFAFSLLERFAFPIFLREDLKADSTFIGVIIGFSWLIMAMPAIVWRKMTETHSPVKLYFFGSALTGLLTMCMSFTPDLFSTICFYILSGFFWGFAGPADWKVLADSANSADRARDMNLSKMGHGVGMIIGPMVSGIIADMAGFRYLFVISGALYLTGALIFLLVIRGYK